MTKVSPALAKVLLQSQDHLFRNAESKCGNTEKSAELRKESYFVKRASSCERQYAGGSKRMEKRCASSEKQKPVTSSNRTQLGAPSGYPAGSNIIPRD
jgi:hypothetical protein